MKKTLLLLGALFMMAAAQAVTISATELSAIGDGVAVPAQGFTFTAAKNSGGTAPTFNANGQDVRVYAKGSLTVAGNSLKKLVFNISTQGKKRLTEITASVGNVVIDKEAWTVTWTGDAAEVTFTVGEKATYGTDGESKAGQFCFASVEVDGEAGTGTNPEVSYTEVTLASLAEATANIANVNLTLTNAKVTHVDGDIVYVREGANAIQFYKTGLELPLNAVLNGTVKGNFVIYNLIPEFTAAGDATNLSTLTVTASEEAAVPVEATVADILAMKYKNELVVLKGISVVADGTRYYAASGADRVQFYKGLDMSGYADDGKAYDVTGLFNATYNKNPEIMPTAVVENASVVVVPAPKFMTEPGTYEGEAEVAIEVPAGCNVFYTLDGTEPNDGSTLYEGPFVVTETTTVKAISYDADDQTSAVVTGVYTITKPVPVVEGEVVNFDFDANEWGHAISTSDAQDAGNITEALTKNGVSLAFVYDEGAKTKPRFWQVVSSGANVNVDVRVYKDQQIVLTAPAGMAIAQATFRAVKAADIALSYDGTALAASAITPAPETGYSKVAATLTPAEAVTSLTVVATATNKLTEIEVVLTKATGIDTSLVTRHSSAIYDLQGRRVQNAQKGVYIIGGHKVMK
ncbi:MAG: chitobiase/beta-hexosaminidase C-terminal domain-containing protein [Alloprevotella sp.]|nr:chitobiase/beta-hexosaminidase C-terminal domain-containing protein [Alloprevotella sp.]MBR1595025.1 chitobiase/beta-hexosaminidase C-terminal domain-containing protein [Alloprevotella sp.]